MRLIYVFCSSCGFWLMQLTLRSDLYSGKYGNVLIPEVPTAWWDDWCTWEASEKKENVVIDFTFFFRFFAGEKTSYRVLMLASYWHESCFCYLHAVMFTSFKVTPTDQKSRIIESLSFTECLSRSASVLTAALVFTCTSDKYSYMHIKL